MKFDGDNCRTLRTRLRDIMLSNHLLHITQFESTPFSYKAESDDDALLVHRHLPLHSMNFGRSAWILFQLIGDLMESVSHVRAEENVKLSLASSVVCSTCADEEEAARAIFSSITRPTARAYSKAAEVMLDEYAGLLCGELIFAASVITNVEGLEAIVMEIVEFLVEMDGSSDSVSEEAAISYICSRGNSDTCAYPFVKHVELESPKAVSLTIMSLVKKGLLSRHTSGEAITLRVEVSESDEFNAARNLEVVEIETRAAQVISKLHAMSRARPVMRQLANNDVFHALQMIQRHGSPRCSKLAFLVISNILQSDCLDACDKISAPDLIDEHFHRISQTHRALSVSDEGFEAARSGHAATAGATSKAGESTASDGLKSVKLHATSDLMASDDGTAGGMSSLSTSLDSVVGSTLTKGSTAAGSHCHIHVGPEAPRRDLEVSGMLCVARSVVLLNSG